MMQTKSQHILVTGGAGFIGSHVVAALKKQGCSVSVLDDLSTGHRDYLPDDIDFVQGDVADAALVASLVAKADKVIHLAAIASVVACEENRSRAHRTNAQGSQNILQAAAQAPHQPRVIYASSAAIYGDAAQLPIAETTTPNPLSIYGADKHFAECEAAHSYQHTQLNSVGLRFFNVYGERQDPASPYSGVISLFAKAALNAKRITIFGDGEQTRDFIYVGDIVRLILAAMHAPDGAHLINGCTGKATSLHKLITLLGDISSHALNADYAAARVGDIRHSLGDAGLADKLLGFRAETPLHDGLGYLLKWMGNA
jgi:UDP-glucose 4-epimerase